MATNALKWQLFKALGPYMDRCIEFIEYIIVPFCREPISIKRLPYDDDFDDWEVESDRQQLPAWHLYGHSCDNSFDMFCQVSWIFLTFGNLFSSCPWRFAWRFAFLGARQQMDAKTRYFKSKTSFGGLPVASINAFHRVWK